MPSVAEPVVHGVLGNTFSLWNPDLLSSSLLGHLQAHRRTPSAVSMNTNVLKTQITQLQRCIHNLEAKNDDLKHENKMQHSEIGALNEEITSLRIDYYDQLDQGRKITISSKSDKEEIRTLRAKVSEANIFIQAIVDLKLPMDVLCGAAQAVKHGYDAEEALINSIMAASTRRGSAWSRIIPAVVGPRGPDHYQAAIKLVLQSRKDLYDRQKASDFWKQKSTSDPSNATTITPSPSELSDICAKMLNEMECSAKPVLDNTSVRSNPRASSPHNVKSDFSVDDQLARVCNELSASKVDSTPQCLGHSIDTYLSGKGVENEAQANLSIKLVRPPTSPHRTKPPSVSSQEVPPKTQASSVAGFPVTSTRINAPPLPPSLPKTPVSRRKVVTRLAGPNSTISVPHSTLKPPTPNSPIRSRLSTPRTKKPLLQNRNANLSSSVIHKFDEGETSVNPSTNPSEVTSRHNVSKVAKDPGKRRGVILVEKDKIPGFKTARETTVVPSTSLVEIYDSPNFPVSVSADVFGADAECEDENVQHRDKETREKDDSVKAETDGIRSISDATEVGLRPTPANPTTLQSRLQNQGLLVCRPQSSPADVEAREHSPTTISVSRLANSFSDSDLGSLEITDDSDSESDSEHILIQDDQDAAYDTPRNFRHIFRQWTEGAGAANLAQDSADGDNERPSSCSDGDDDDDDFGSTPVGPVGPSRSVSSMPASGYGLVSRPATPIAKSRFFTTAKDRTVLSMSKSDLSCTSSMSSSGSDKRFSGNTAMVPLLGLARRLGRKSSTSLNLSKKQISWPILPTQTMASSLVQPSPGSIKFPTPTSHHRPSSSKQLNNLWSLRKTTPSNPGKAVNPQTPPNPIKPVSPSNPKSSLLSIRPTSGPQHTSSKPESKAVFGQSIMNRLSNVPSPSKPTPVLAQSPKTSSTYLTVSTRPTKPRSNTINALSPLPSTLSTPSPKSLMAASTKPRSNTFNAYLPTTRSPLSRLVTNMSLELELEPQPHTNSTKPPPPRRAPPQYPAPKSLPRKAATSSKVSAPTTKTTPPLRVNKKSPPTKPQSTPRDAELKPPIAAFMRRTPAPSTSINARRVSSSIAPLIPNWTAASKEGAVTKGECRGLFRNSLSMVVR
ncbi:hypothetical protein GALMADRAFT_156999 [Galerina marginata CBS 339.88]|uniref:Uncharacterized protein n=1 Tax=Galerina marginata (strain CBS 339.88) TaxID=685588 RepID=A0A067T5C5_GALM3|nr:hypothetical protein GALMADRAFT_156999 [Galerina marginata CBS 339.88]